MWTQMTHKYNKVEGVQNSITELYAQQICPLYEVGFKLPKIYRKHNAYWSFKNSTAKKLMWKHPNYEAYRSIPLMCPTCPDLCSLVKNVKYMLCPEKSCCYMRVCRNGSVWIFPQGMFSIILSNTFRYSFNIL